MTLDPASRQVVQKISVAPSPATSGVDWAIDDVTDYFLNALEQQVPLKVQVYPQNEQPTKQNSETILITAYTAGTRGGTVTVAEVASGAQPGGPVDVQEQQLGDGNIPQTEIQVLTLDATGGTYTLTFGGNTTAAINWNDNAATIQARLQALASIGAGGITVAGTGPFTLTFAGARANQPQALITADATNLIAGGPGSLAVAHTVVGGGGQNDVQTITVTADAGTFTLTFGGNTTSLLPENSSADAVATELQALASIGSGNVDVQGPDGGPFVVTFQGALGLAAQAVITGNATLLVTGGTNDIQTVTVDADAGTFKLSLDGVNFTAAMAPGVAAATMQTNLQALAAIGAGNCQVTADTDLLVYTVQFCGALGNQSVAPLTTDVTALTQTTVHVTACTRAMDGTTARTIVVGDHVEAALVTPGVGRGVASWTAVWNTLSEGRLAEFVIPPDTLPSRLVRLEAWGTYLQSTPAPAKDCPTIRVRFGGIVGTIVLDSGNTAGAIITANTNAAMWRVRVELFNFPGGAPAATTIYTMMEGNVEVVTLAFMNGNGFNTGVGYVRTVAAGSSGAHVWYRGVDDVGQSVDTTVPLTVTITGQLNDTAPHISHKMVTLGSTMEVI